MDPIRSGSSVMPSIRTFASDASQAQGKADDAEKKSVPKKPLTTIPTKEQRVPTTKHKKTTKKDEAKKILPKKSTATEVKKELPQSPVPKKEAPADLFKKFSEEVEEIATKGPERGDARGEVIRETLKDRWTLGKALKQEFKKWVAEQNAVHAGPDVAPAANRTPIIKKAGAGSAIAPQDDYSRAIEALRKRRETKVAQDFEDVLNPQDRQVKEETVGEEEEVAHWTHHTEEAPATTESSAGDSRAIKTARPRIGEEAVARTAPQTSVVDSPSPEDLIAPKISTHTKRNALSPQLQRQAAAREEEKAREERKADIARRKAEAAAREKEKEARLRAEAAREKQLREERAAQERERAREGAEKQWERAAKREAKEEVAFHNRTFEERKEAEAAVLKGATKQSPYREVVGEDQTFVPSATVIPTSDEQEKEPLMPMPTRQPEAEAPKRQASVVRTYRNDAIENVRERNLSRLQIATAEAKEREERLRHADPRVSEAYASRETPILLILILIFAILSAGFAGYLWFVRGDSNTTPITVTRVPTFIAGVEQESIPFSTERSVLMTNMTENARQSKGTNSITQFYFVDPETGAGEKVVPVSQFMDVFDPRTNVSFARSLKSDMMFGVYQGERTNPYFIFRTEQFDVAFAGMLAWEENMSADLSPLFGEPVRRSFDPTSFSSDSSRAAGFVDDVLRNTNVRILYDELGDVRVVYAFIDKQTIVITSSVESMIALIEALRS